jgi:hypothetical protein
MRRFWYVAARQMGQHFSCENLSKDLMQRSWKTCEQLRST